MVRKGEGDLLEFKRKASFPEKIVKEVVAFANTRGGDLLLGVDDNGTIPGVRHAEEEAFALESAIRHYCYPRIRYRSETVSISEKKSVLLYRIFESRRKPHFVRAILPGSTRKSYVRIGDKSVQASREVIEILKRSRSAKGIKFSYGDKEKWLMQYLEKHQSISVYDYQSLAGINRQTASSTLIRLALANVLRVEPGEEKDYFRINQERLSS
jgi:predicted HTH transcriptional regulator